MARDRSGEARRWVPSFAQWLVENKMELDGYAAYTYARKHVVPDRGRQYQKEIGLALLKLTQEEYKAQAEKREHDEAMASNPLAGSW
jgi:hypothetical protein